MTSNPRWTPGPWKVGDACVYTKRGDASVVVADCEAEEFNGAIPEEEEVEANSVLISAAPEMAEALEAAPKPRYTINEAEMCKQCQECAYTEWYYNQRAAALRKARGE